MENSRYKFRAWLNGKMLSPERTEVEISLRGLQQSNDFVLMQFTGLKDKNGVEIFEGDILKDEENGGYQCVWSESDCGFLFDNLHGEYFSADDLSKSDLEIIGNVWEHPHLQV